MRFGLGVLWFWGVGSCIGVICDFFVRSLSTRKVPTWETWMKD